MQLLGCFESIESYIHTYQIRVKHNYVFVVAQSYELTCENVEAPNEPADVENEGEHDGPLNSKKVMIVLFEFRSKRASIAGGRRLRRKKPQFPARAPLVIAPADRLRPYRKLQMTLLL
ncbi:hypothetical protein EVAR_86075_1 [Eumeta japonica]|uniref:Uncharacterized protein n=1 Tax=Eumeta variegata TaxID=151549 RepID=A0A4C1UJB5_EUMVA|nr:hypothetical protein EVAR_86075_1 [Eumeta japonica]